MSNEAALRDIKSRISQKVSTRARAEVELETATKSREAALKTLKEDFGVQTAEDIQRIFDSLQAEVDDSIAEIVSILDKE